MSINILITGAAGYIGSHIAKDILKKTAHKITIIDNLSTGKQETIDRLIALGGERVQFIKADLNDFSMIEGVFKTKRFDALIHFAANIVAPESVTNPLKYYLNNTVNTTNLISLANRYGVGRFIFSSTAAVYGEPPKMPIDESAPPSPLNPYGTSKLMSEIVLQDSANANSDFKYCILRYFNVAGADMDGEYGQCTPDATHLIKVASQTALGRREKMYIFGDDYETRDGTCIRDYIHVDDLSSAHLMALEYLEKNPSDIFNVGYGEGYTVREVIAMMREVSGVQFLADIAPKRAGDSKEIVADSSKIRAKMGWSPKHNDLKKICRSAFEWEKRV